MDAKLQQLSELLEVYFRENPRIRHEHSKNHYRWAISDLAEYLGREPLVSDLSVERIAGLMVWLRDGRRRLTPAGVNGRRHRLGALWRWCASRGWILPPTYIPLAVEPQKIPQAWTVDELKQLFWAASRCPGSYDGISLRVWWPAFLGIMWDSGERTTAVMSLEWRHLRSDGVLHVPAQIRKGQRRDMVYRLHSDTLLTLAVVKAARYRGPDSQIFGTGHYSKFYYKYDRLLKLAGLPTGRLNGPHKLRRSFATYIKLLGGDATAALGHSSDAVTRRSYLDPTICESAPNEKLFRLLPAQPAVPANVFLGQPISSESESGRLAAACSDNQSRQLPGFRTNPRPPREP